MSLLKTIKLTKINPYGEESKADFTSPFKLSRGLEFKFSGKHVLLDGESGTGKTTLLKLIESNFLKVLDLENRNKNLNDFAESFEKYSAEIQFHSASPDVPDCGEVEFVNNNGFPSVDDINDAFDCLGDAQANATKNNFDKVISKLIPYVDNRFNVNGRVLSSYLNGFGLGTYYNLDKKDIARMDNINFLAAFMPLLYKFARKNKIEERVLFGSLYMAICPEARVFDTDSNLTFEMSHTGNYPNNVFSSYEKPESFEGSEGQYLMHVVDDLVPHTINNNNNSLILLDEVSSKIDRKRRKDYQEKLIGISNRNNQIICTSHSDSFYDMALENKNWTVIDFDSL